MTDKRTGVTRLQVKGSQTSPATTSGQERDAECTLSRNVQKEPAPANRTSGPRTAREETAVAVSPQFGVTCYGGPGQLARSRLAPEQGRCSQAASPPASPGPEDFVEASRLNFRFSGRRGSKAGVPRSGGFTGLEGFPYILKMDLIRLPTVFLASMVKFPPIITVLHERGHLRRKVVGARPVSKFPHFSIEG